MSAWFSKNLGDAMLAQEQLNRIETLFLSMYTEAGRPMDMALFYRHESGRLHCEVKVYLSPAAAAVAKKIGAAPCERPAWDGLSLSAGDQKCWSLFFPGKEI
jgi:hypothetical protein